MYTIKMAEAPKEYKMIVWSLKATNDQKGIVEGILNAIGNIDDGNDRTMPGAFKRTLDAAYARKAADSTIDFLWPYLWNHDYNLIPPGGIFDADEVKASGDRPAGLFIKAQMNLDYQLGRDLYSSFKFGSVRKQSMGYKALKYDWVQEKGAGAVRNLVEVALMEGSAVVFPMNDLSDVTGVKSSGNWTPKKYFFMNGKGKTMEQPQKKDFNDRYRPQQIQDWIGGLYSLTSALRQAIMDAFSMGDQPLDDVKGILNGMDNSPGFISSLMDWVQEGIDLDFSNYLEEQDSSGSMPSVYGYMSRAENEEHWREMKEGRSISAANATKLQKHVETAKNISSQANAIAKDLNTLLNGQQAYANGPKSADSSPETLSAKAADHTDSDDDQSTQVLDGLLASLQKTNQKLKP